MIGYAKFAVIVLLAIAAQWLINQNDLAVREAIFTIRCGATNLIGTEAERAQLLEYAKRLNDDFRARVPDELDCPALDQSSPADRLLDDEFALELADGPRMAPQPIANAWMADQL